MSEAPRLAILRLPGGEGLPLPAYQSVGAAGLDLCAAIPEGETVVLMPGQRALIPTGFAIAIPLGFEGQVRPRSGNALHRGMTCLNTPGTIDADYRGEIGVILINLGQEAQDIVRGERIAQLVIAPVQQVQIEETHQLDGTVRGAKGFGSTDRGANK